MNREVKYKTFIKEEKERELKKCREYGGRKTHSAIESILIQKNGRDKVSNTASYCQDLVGRNPE